MAKDSQPLSFSWLPNQCWPEGQVAIQIVPKRTLEWTSCCFYGWRLILLSLFDHFYSHSVFTYPSCWLHISLFHVHIVCIGWFHHISLCMYWNASLLSSFVKFEYVSYPNLYLITQLFVTTHCETGLRGDAWHAQPGERLALGNLDNPFKLQSAALGKGCLSLSKTKSASLTPPHN